MHNVAAIATNQIRILLYKVT